MSVAPEELWFFVMASSYVGSLSQFLVQLSTWKTPSSREVGTAGQDEATAGGLLSSDGIVRFIFQGVYYHSRKRIRSNRRD